MKRIQNLRVDYSGKILDLDNINKNPIDEFKKWFKEAQKKNILEPNAMTLSTVSTRLKPVPIQWRMMGPRC